MLYNSNVTKDKDIILENLMLNYDTVFLQEHLLTAASSNFLRRNSAHRPFITHARPTKGRSSGGLACTVKDVIIASQFYSNSNLLAIRIGNTISINCYLLHDKRYTRSFPSFSMVCKKLGDLISSVTSKGFSWVMFVDFNVTSSCPSSVPLWNALPDDFQIVPMNLPFSYIHQSGSKTNIDYCILGSDISLPQVLVNEDTSNIDHFPLLTFVSITVCPTTERLSKYGFTDVIG